MCVNDDVANAGDTRFLTSGEVMAHSPESESGKYSSRTYGVQMVRHRLDTKRPMSPTSRMFGLQPIKLCRMIVVPRLGQQYIYFIQHTLNHIRRYETIVCDGSRWKNHTRCTSPSWKTVSRWMLFSFSFGSLVCIVTDGGRFAHASNPGINVFTIVVYVLICARLMNTNIYKHTPGMDRQCVHIVGQPRAHTARHTTPQCTVCFGIIKGK